MQAPTSEELTASCLRSLLSAADLKAFQVGRTHRVSRASCVCVYVCVMCACMYVNKNSSPNIGKHPRISHVPRTHTHMYMYIYTEPAAPAPHLGCREVRHGAAHLPRYSGQFTKKG
jgi:hypothetical protein